jgi:hypothetical protein
MLERLNLKSSLLIICGVFALSASSAALAHTYELNGAIRMAIIACA